MGAACACACCGQLGRIAQILAATQPLSLSARTTAILSSMPNGPAKTRLTELQSRIVAQQTRALTYVNISLARKSLMQRGTY